MTTYNEYVNWLIENKKDFSVNYKNGKIYSITATLQNQFGETIQKDLYASYLNGEIVVRCVV